MEPRDPCELEILLKCKYGILKIPLHISPSFSPSFLSSPSLTNIYGTLSMIQALAGQRTKQIMFLPCGIYILVQRDK